MESKNSQRMISEAIRKIALGRSIERVDMSGSGTGGVGTARMIHGYVAKIHEDGELCGTIDVREFPDETASSEPITHQGVLLSGVKDNSGGFLIIPTLFSDVTIVTDAATKYSYVLNFSHADFIQLLSHKESVIGVSETEELDPESNDSPDYDELEKTGNETSTKYTAESIKTIVTFYRTKMIRRFYTCNILFANLYIHGGYLYYSPLDFNGNRRNTIWRAKTDGSAKEEVVADQTSGVIYYKDKIYYQSEGLFSVNMDGSGRVKLLDEADRIAINDDKLYYETYEFEEFTIHLNCCALDGTSPKQVAQYNDYITFTFGSDKIYAMIGSGNTFSLIEMNKDGSGTGTCHNAQFID